MLFSSLSFIFRFLPIFFLIYFLVPDKAKNIVLILGSLCFYALGEPFYVIIMIGSIIVNYFLSYVMTDMKTDTGKNLIMALIVFLDLGILFVFKYYNFFTENVNLVAKQELLPALNLTLPLGISFYTFQMLSYAIDLKRGKVATDFWSFATYVCMFPQLVAGPILKYDEVDKDLYKRKVKLEDIQEGLVQFCFGLGFKALLANQIFKLWNETEAIGFSSLSTPMAWLGAFAFSFYIYFDFWGYSLMAMGLGRIMGFSFPKNFDMPYMSVSMTEFWRRWHITLGRFFKEYVYIPLGGSRVSAGRKLLNLFVVWALTGLWHGASWNFVIWGLVFFVLLGLEKNVFLKLLEKQRWLGHIYVIVLVPVTWVVFQITDLNQLVIYLKDLIGIRTEAAMVGTSQFVGYLKDYGLLLAVCIFCSTGIPAKLYEKFKGKVILWILAFLVFWASVYELAVSAVNPFLYFRF